MSPLVWWTIPAAATLSAIAWNGWRTRSRGPVDPFESVRDFERVRSALAVEPTPPTPRRRAESDD